MFLSKYDMCCVIDPIARTGLCVVVCVDSQ